MDTYSAPSYIAVCDFLTASNLVDDENNDADDVDDVDDDDDDTDDGDSDIDDW
eukprot:CAMPEP_0203659126 /NCGR_PEP_ID=MMETSP0088-20131115/50741_1 /ASSEMBLY_ACC=CAM_ASM_001087 /TAXON_ID=426623 /ORGANISM="Chaetoceros affinis, Strain CCMP159" /LENGTH=52 /DNA_ID=CAMNT_0050521039 /DNA_START=27 /DNA_END=182 /DNA_ORIENTATION=+